MTASTPGRSSTGVEARSVDVDVSGWYAFASIMLLVSGFLNGMHGYIAVAESDYIVNQLFFENLDVWGWVFMGFGALQLLAGAMSLAMRTIGPVIGISLASIAMVLWFAMIFAAPFPALVGLAINATIIYGLTRYETA